MNSPQPWHASETHASAPSDHGQVFRAPVAHGPGRVLGCLVAVCLGVSLWVRSASLMIEAYIHYGPAAAWAWSRPWWVATAVWGSIALALCLWLWWARGAMVILTPRGFSLIRPPRRPVDLLWREVRGVEVHLRRIWPWRQVGGQITWHLRQGGRVRLRSIMLDMPAVAHEAQRAWYADRLPHFRRQWQQGKALDFGALQVDATGIRWKQHEFPWRAVQGVALQDGRLMIELKHPHPHTVGVPLRQVYSPEALLWWLHEEARR